MRFLLLCAFLLFCASFGARAQQGVELGFGPGVAVYQGDVNPSILGATNRPGASFQVFGSYVLHPAFAVRANYAYASISDDERGYGGYRDFRNFKFQSTINELSLQIVVSPLATYDPVRLQPYFFGGLGVGFTSVTRDWSRFDYNFPYWQRWVVPGLAQDTMTALPTSIVTFPVGLGLRYNIGENISLYTEATQRLTNTEYLDGFSKSANSKRNDAFTTISVGLILRLSQFSDWRGGRGRTDCPVDVY